MEYILFTGTWRITNQEVEKDVRKAVRDVFASGKGVLTGGATGVDYFCMDEALKIDPTGKSLMVLIPAFLEDYINDYYTNWLKYPVKKEDVDSTADILRKFKKLNPSNFVEAPNKIITPKDFDIRSEEEVKVASGVYAFHVNDSIGTQYTLDYAVSKKVPILLHKKYNITV